MKIFGFEIRKQAQLPAIVQPTNTDGALEQYTGTGAAHYGYAFDANKRLTNAVEIINKYRSMAQVAEIDNAIEEIVTEAVVVEEEKLPVSVKIIAEDNEIPEPIKDAILDEFNNILALMEFNTSGHDLFRQFYVDGVLSAQIVVDETNLSAGIQGIRFLDPRKIKKIRDIQKERSPSGVDIVTGIEDYFVYNDSGINSATTGIRLSPDVILYVTSGLVDEAGNTISFLHKGIKPSNMLRYMEDAVLIYTIARAPERRAFYIDVSGMPKQKGEQYMRDVMNRYKNKVIYDSGDGTIKDDRVHLSMLEDYWLPRTSNGRTTEITTLPGSSVMSQMDNVNYFLNKLYNALNLPLSRMRPDAGFSLGRSTEITRDEIKFSKFIARLRRKFSEIFYQALRTQLILKGIIKPEDWIYVKSKINFDFLRDNYFAELKENEVLSARIEMVNQMAPYLGIYFSHEMIKKDILKQSDEQVEHVMAQIGAEYKENPASFPALIQQQEMLQPGGAGE